MKPRSALRPAASTRLGSTLGRMASRSELIGLASASAADPPPNSAALADEVNDQVTASFMPRAASRRRAVRTSRWRVLTAGLMVSLTGGSMVDGMAWKPWMRATSSTRSASPSISVRQLGTLAWMTPPNSSAAKPSDSSRRTDSAAGISMPVRVRTRSGRISAVLRHSGTAPASTSSLASPPQISRISRVASSAPPMTYWLSTPRSKR